MVFNSMIALGVFLFVTAIYQLSGRLVDIECEYNAQYHSFSLKIDSERAGFFSQASRRRWLRLNMTDVVYEEALWEKWGEDIEFLRQFNLTRDGDFYFAELIYADGDKQALGYISQACRNNLKAWTERHPAQSQNWKID